MRGHCLPWRPVVAILPALRAVSGLGKCEAPPSGLDLPESPEANDSPAPAAPRIATSPRQRAVTARCGECLDRQQWVLRWPSIAPATGNLTSIDGDAVNRHAVGDVSPKHGPYPLD